MSTFGSSVSPHIRLGMQCRELNRLGDAERHFKDALAEDPNDDFALQQLAMTIHMQDDREREALEVIDRAIGVDPNDAYHHACRAFILCSLDRGPDALKSARTARELDPYLDAAITAEAQAHLVMKNWAQAERAAREALAIDPDEAAPANLLSHALRMQGKSAENDAQIAGLLERDPENEHTHFNAGWSALNRGDHRAAEIHFREALRLNPSFDPAREGLLTSFRARSPIYRGYLNYCLWMSRLKKGAQWAVIIGLYVGFRILRNIADRFSPSLAISIGVLYFLFVLWVFVADAVGNFILLFDRSARHALRKPEKIEAAVVGGGIVAGITLLIPGIVFDFASAAILGDGLILAAIPLSMVFTNRARPGVFLFSAVAACVLVGTALLLVGARAGEPVALFGLFGVIASTWLSSVPFLRQRY
jgi:tetratricopeptide (TPR) repeat protein